MKMHKQIATLDCKSSAVADVVYVLQQLASMAPAGSTVNVEMQLSGTVGAAWLFEETLTDGSKVYNIQLG